MELLPARKWFCLFCCFIACFLVCWVGLCGVCQLIDASRRGSRWVSAVGLGIVTGGKSSLSLTYPMLMGEGPKKTGASG